MKLSELKNKKILVLGFGREGKDTYDFLKKKGLGSVIGIADIKEDLQKEEATMHLGSSYLKAIGEYDIIIRSPGIPLSKIQEHLTSQQTLTSQTEIFFSNMKGTIIGITGTKGKSTTASLMYEVLKKEGVRAHLIGNIGKPVLEFLYNNSEDDVFVYELSSFQLATLKISPHIAVFLNLYEEHLDWHGTFKEYAESKANITRFQTIKDYIIFNKEDDKVKAIVDGSKAQKIGFKENRGKNMAASKEPILLVAELFGIPQKTAEKTVQEFKGLEHRLQKVGTYNGITFYNDSLATIPEATIAALDILGEDVQTLIAGGLDRGVSYEELGKRIQESNIETLILFKDTGDKILRAVNNNIKHIFVDSMEEAVENAFKATNNGRICLLSPASSSFNLFKDYEDRGNQFIKYAKEDPLS
ncbi:MAG TPA: UDP-N-acetylmuramoyl-L-alanine--D-glutamate ligase [candidate division CPR3 bacterium]|uniref:UDP-N-acetylmuramoylalanine--D-glutamate ligase n=1 Tax=candidate division CPR3 bacterium TaxID=2268181 RepID=A0A7C1S987_UNCC3|nr:UDP-N-acetylmuramoyl-L-alanine--D-glutamate ligase [candidate division CPR3 bacterium]